MSLVDMYIHTRTLMYICTYTYTYIHIYSSFTSHLVHFSKKYWWCGPSASKKGLLRLANIPYEQRVYIIPCSHTHCDLDACEMRIEREMNSAVLNSIVDIMYPCICMYASLQAWMYDEQNNWFFDTSIYCGDRSIQRKNCAILSSPSLLFYCSQLERFVQLISLITPAAAGCVLYSRKVPLFDLVVNYLLLLFVW